MWKLAKQRLQLKLVQLQALRFGETFCARGVKAKRRRGAQSAGRGDIYLRYIRAKKDFHWLKDKWACGEMAWSGRCYNGLNPIRIVGLLKMGFIGNEEWEVISKFKPKTLKLILFICCAINISFLDQLSFRSKLSHCRTLLVRIPLVAFIKLSQVEKEKSFLELSPFGLSSWCTKKSEMLYNSSMNSFTNNFSRTHHTWLA